MTYLAAILYCSLAGQILLLIEKPTSIPALSQLFFYKRSVFRVIGTYTANCFDLSKTNLTIISEQS